MSAIRYEPFDSPSTETEAEILKTGRNVEVNFLYLDADGAVDVQLFRGKGSTDKLSGLISVPAGGVIPPLYLPPGQGIPVPSGGLFLVKTGAVQIGGIVGWSLSSEQAIAAIEEDTPHERALRKLP